MKLMTCPLSVNDRTKTEECNKIVLSMFELVLFIKARGETAGTQLEVV